METATLREATAALGLKGKGEKSRGINPGAIDDIGVFQNPVQRREWRGGQYPAFPLLLSLTFLQVLPTVQVQLEAKNVESTGSSVLGHRAGRGGQRAAESQRVTLTVKDPQSTGRTGCI